MNGSALSYIRAGNVADALHQGAQPTAAYFAGGTDLMQLWKLGVPRPRLVVDISRLPLADVHLRAGLLNIGALAKLSDVASHQHVARSHPLIVEAIFASASGQVRNMATVGGNLMQRTRCAYFRTEGFACNKRAPGSGCSALAGENRSAALFGASAACVATHPSDLAVALAALDAQVTVLGSDGERRFGLADLYRLPGDSPEIDTTLARGDLITSVEVKDAERFAPRSTYLKVRDRASFEFAVVSVAAALRFDGGVIVEARLAIGGVAPMPWRLSECESILVGRTPNAESFSTAAALAVRDAQPLAQNGFKIELLKRAIVRALETIGGPQ